TSRKWQKEHDRPGTPGLRRLHRLAVATVAVVFLQLILGAIMRHIHAGTAISTFPLAWGMWVPPLQSRSVQVNFAHRVWALVLALRSRRPADLRLAREAVLAPSRLADFAMLTKPRITFLVLVCAFVGFRAGARGALAWGPLLEALLGTALLASGASALNQFLE